MLYLPVICCGVGESTNETDSLSVALPAKYLEQGLCNGMLSVCLSVPFACCSSMRSVCCSGPCGQAILIDCCPACMQQAWPPFDPYSQQHGSQQQIWAVSCLQRRRKLNTDWYSDQLISERMKQNDNLFVSLRSVVTKNSCRVVQTCRNCLFMHSVAAIFSNY